MAWTCFCNDTLELGTIYIFKSTNIIMIIYTCKLLVEQIAKSMATGSNTMYAIETKYLTLLEKKQTKQNKKKKKKKKKKKNPYPFILHKSHHFCQSCQSKYALTVSFLHIQTGCMYLIYVLNKQD